MSKHTRKWIDQLQEPITMVTVAVEHLRVKQTPAWIQQLEKVAEGVSQDRLTRTELQLLPVLAAALRDALPDHPATAIALGAKRRAAAEALLANSAARLAATALSRNGIAVAPLKGIALDGFYSELGWRRPMGDADLLILEPTDWSTLTDVMKSGGFLPGPGSVHARNFDLSDGRRVDVHRYVSTPNAYPGALNSVLSLLSLSDSDASLYLELPPEFHMAHAIEHAMRWNPILPARSISDIAVLYETTPNLDWPLVHSLLFEWAADRNGLALLSALECAGLVPADALTTGESSLRSRDTRLQAWATADPRRTWVKQPIQYFGLVPWRLKRHDLRFSYRNYLRGLWSMENDDSIASAIWKRIRARINYGRNLPQYIHE